MDDITGLFNDLLCPSDIDLDWLKKCLLEDPEFIRKLIKIIEKEKYRKELNGF